MKNILTKNKSFSLFLYKISIDILILLLIFFSAMFLCDTILPGTISDHLSFLKFSFLIIATATLATYLGIKNEIKFKKIIFKKNKKLTIALSALFIVLMIISLRKFLPLENLVITFTSCVILFYFYKILMK